MSFALLLYPLYHHHLEVHGSKPHLQPLLRCSPLLSLLCGIQIFCNLVWVSSSISRDILDVTGNDTTVHKLPGLTSCPANCLFYCCGHSSRWTALGQGSELSPLAACLQPPLLLLSPCLPLVLYVAVGTWVQRGRGWAEVSRGL